MKIWKENNDIFDYQLYKKIDSFFEHLRDSEDLEYREGQHTMALDVMESIKRKEIVLIEAEVGSGKSWGYLVPLIYASENKEKFKGFIVSTSSIALQEQLKLEIEKIGKLLNIDIPVTVAKGRNNFICQKRLDTFINYNSGNKFIEGIMNRVSKGIIDKEQYDDIPLHVWNRINVDKANCTSCLYQSHCGYILERKKWPSASYVICNHDLLVESLKRDNLDMILKEPSILVVDEAHALEEKIYSSYQESIDKGGLEALIQMINFQINDFDDLQYFIENPILNSINKVFRMISTSAKYEYRKTTKRDKEALDSETSGFHISKALKEELTLLNTQLVSLIREAENYNKLDSKLLNNIDHLKKYTSVFKDLVKKESNRENIYWVSFLPNTKDHIIINYVTKHITKISSKLLSSSSYGKVFTSATMTTKKNDYNYFSNSLGLNEITGIPVVREFSQDSPYDYDSNSLLYLAQDVVSPKYKDNEIYLDSLAKKIIELLNITEGRSLVLFTSKKDMLDVYNRVLENTYNFNIFIQKDGISADILKKKFMDDVTSTLFATGSFWEGIDVKGEALSSVIIAKLPFPLVSPIIEEKAGHYSNGFREVYMPEMLIKLKQGTGRLIRSEKDKGIVSIIDSRTKEYESEIIEALPFRNVTTNINDVISFKRKNLVKTNVKK